MKVVMFAFTVFCFSAAHAVCLPKVAVLDAILGDNIKEDVAIPVSEKIGEELTSSGQFTVLDRAAVYQSLKKIQFQMSKFVRDAEIMRAGERLNSQLGASYVVVSKAALVLDTYFISVKMVDAKTGKIIAQDSDEEQGDSSITLDIARRLGSKLAAMALGSQKDTADTLAP